MAVNNFKLHLCIKKSYFLLIILLKSISAVCRRVIKKNRHIQATMNPEEATRAMLVSGLRAGRIVPEKRL
jgi:hypothetical protein